MAASGLPPAGSTKLTQTFPTNVNITHIKSTEKKLGQGDFGSVYNYDYGRFAIKIANDDDKSREMLKKENDMYTTLEDNNSFPKIESYGEEGYLIMEKLHDTLFNLIYRDRIPGKYKKYFKQMVDAVKKCHDKSICHHDIKLENFMTARNLGYSIKLLDFGLSHKFNETITATPIDVAKTLSRPPEILENFNCNGKYDIFMLGRCLFEIEGGRAPFENTHDDKWWTAFKDKDKKNFWKLNEQKGFTPSQEFKELFEGMMNPDPEKRFDIDKVILSKYYQRCKEDFEKMSSTVGVAVAVGAPVASPFKKYKKRKSNKHLRVQRISRKKASVSRKKSKRGSARARRSLKRGSAHSRQSRRL